MNPISMLVTKALAPVPVPVFASGSSTRSPSGGRWIRIASHRTTVGATAQEKAIEPRHRADTDHTSPRRREQNMKALVDVLLSAQLALLITITSTPASAQLEANERHPVLILQRGDVIPGAGGRTVASLSGPVEAGGDHVGIGAVLSDGGEGALLTAHHSGRRGNLILASDVGALRFQTNRFGILAEPLWGAAEEMDIPFAVMARMSTSERGLLTTWGVAQRLGASAPGLGRDASITAVNRIQMLLNAQTYWVANWSAPGESGKAFFRRQPGPSASVDLQKNALPDSPVCRRAMSLLRGRAPSLVQREPDDVLALRRQQLRACPVWCGDRLAGTPGCGVRVGWQRGHARG